MKKAHGKKTGRRTAMVLLIAMGALFAGSLQAQQGKGGLPQQLQNIVRGAATGALGGSLSNDEVVRGLKEALSIGTNHAAASASKVGGYLNNPMIRIPFPPDAQRVKAVVEGIGMQRQVDDFVRTLNRAAEEAAKEAGRVFLDAILQMTIADGYQILRGPDDAATAYLRRTTTVPLTAKFRPIVKRAIEKVEVTKYWNPIITAYNRVPFVQRINPDLDAYVTEKGLQGLFSLIAGEERKIRRDPAARTTELLRKVFGGK
jgi:hypothetical protein